MKTNNRKLVKKLYRYRRLEAAILKLISIDEAILSYNSLGKGDIVESETQLSIDFLDNYIIEWKITKIQA